MTATLNDAKPVGPAIGSVLKLEVPIIVRLGERLMTVEEVIGLAPGALIELPKSAEAELDLMVNNKVVGTGTAAKVGENFGIRISFIGDVRSRLEAALNSGPTAGNTAAA